MVLKKKKPQKVCPTFLFHGINQLKNLDKEKFVKLQTFESLEILIQDASRLREEMLNFAFSKKQDCLIIDTQIR